VSLTLHEGSWRGNMTSLWQLTRYGCVFRYCEFGMRLWYIFIYFF
jgi:hypothetical protein